MARTEALKRIETRVDAIAILYDGGSSCQNSGVINGHRNTTAN